MTRFCEPPNIVVASEAVTIVTAVWIVKIVPILMMKNNKRYILIKNLIKSFEYYISGDFDFFIGNVKWRCYSYSS